MGRVVAKPRERRRHGAGERATLDQVYDSKAGNQEARLASRIHLELAFWVWLSHVSLLQYLHS